LTLVKYSFSTKQQGHKMTHQVFNLFLAKRNWLEAEATAKRRKDFDCSRVDRLIADAALDNLRRRAAELLSTN
jgi:hypothetical protein